MTANKGPEVGQLNVRAHADLLQLFMTIFDDAMTAMPDKFAAPMAAVSNDPVLLEAKLKEAMDFVRTRMVISGDVVIEDLRKMIATAIEELPARIAGSVH